VRPSTLVLALASTLAPALAFVPALAPGPADSPDDASVRGPVTGSLPRNPGRVTRVIVSVMIARLAAVVALAVPCFAPGAAQAGPLAQALARGDDAAIAALRAQPGDPGARCTLGAIYARRGDLPRAGFYFTTCVHAVLPDDIAGPVGKVARETLRKLEDGDLATIEVMSTMDGVPVESTALPGESFKTPTTLWARPGTYEVRAQVAGAVRSYTVVAAARKRTPVIIEIPAAKGPPPARDQAVSFEDEAIGEQETAPPPDVKHPNIMPKRYRGAAALRESAPGGSETGSGTAGGDEGGAPELADPLAVRAAARPPRAHWIGARVAGGLFDDGHAGARAGLGVAATARYALSTHPSGGPGAFLAARLDWSRRGGRPDDAMAPASGAAGSTIDVLGAAAGAGLTVLDRGALSLALIGQLRADLRLASARSGEPVQRAGLGAAVGAELALPGTPLTAGFRFEQGITELVAGARDRAVLLEVGVDWR
jgi:hypothetical protein